MDGLPSAQVNLIFGEAEVHVVTDDDVVEKGDVEGLSSLFNSGGLLQVVLTRPWIPRRMVVDQNDPAGSLVEGFPDHEPWVDNR